MSDSIDVLAALAAITLAPTNTLEETTFTAEKIATMMGGGRWSPGEDEIKTLKELESSDHVVYHGEQDDLKNFKWANEMGRWSITDAGLYEVFRR